MASGSSRIGWEKERESLERAGMLCSNYRLFAEVVCLSDTNLHTRARTHARTRAHAHARTHTHTHTHSHTHTHIHTHSLSLSLSSSVSGRRTSLFLLDFVSSITRETAFLNVFVSFFSRVIQDQKSIQTKTAKDSFIHVH